MRQKASDLIKYLAGTLLVVSATTPAWSAPGTWQDPAAGWEAIYDASSNLLPWDLSGTGTDQTWSNRKPRDQNPGFLSPDPNTANYAGIVTDEASGQLAMEMNTTDLGLAIAALDVPPGTGANTDLLTIDFKFRLFSDLPVATDYNNLPLDFPLLLNITRPPTPAQLVAKPDADEQFWQLRLRRANIFALGANSSGGNQNQSGASRLSNEWHEMRFQVDVATGSASIYLDGSDVPEITDLYPRTTILGDPSLAENSVYFGAAGSGIDGVASVEYVKITTSELAPVTGGGVLIGDLDGDGFVGINDLNIVLGNWNQNVPPANPLADPSGDGFVGIDDLNAVLGNWNAGTPPSSTATIPEPGTLVCLGLMSLIPLRRRQG